VICFTVIFALLFALLLVGVDATAWQAGWGKETVAIGYCGNGQNERGRRGGEQLQMTDWKRWIP
jgi:hypothetical protein